MSTRAGPRALPALAAGLWVLSLGLLTLGREPLTVVDQTIEPTGATLWLRPGQRRAAL
jgi:hypothetical protein